MGDLDGALASYREVVQRLGHANQNSAAGDYLVQVALLSSMTGRESAAMVFAQQQKLGGEELNAVALLQTLAGNRAAALQTQQRYRASKPSIASRALETNQALADTAAAILRGDGQGALAAAAPLRNLQLVPLLYLKGRAHVLTGEYASAEAEFRQELRYSRNLANFALFSQRFPAVEMLSHYYLGQVYEKTGKRDQAINEYQEFLSHFDKSRATLPQIADARAALKRLMQ
jgi:tetratricopeptide (TPR) repeat protein